MRCSAALVAATLTAVGNAALSARAAEPGQAIFQGGCATCHAAGSPRVLAGQPLLSHTRAMTGADPAHAIGLILNGHEPPPEQRGAWMPAYADVLSDAQVADVLAWLRQAAGAPPWTDLTERVHALRASATGDQR